MTKIVRGAVQRTAGAYDGMFTGQKGVGFPAQAVWQEQMPILEVLVQSDPTSAVNIYIGNQTGQYVCLVPGQSITVPINNLNMLYAGTDVAGGVATLNWIAMT